MRLRLWTSLTALALAGFVGSSAQALMIAGWDFSQYAGDGFMSTDGGSGTNTLDANYSDVSGGAELGTVAAPFGTMYVDGSFGSTDVAALSGTEEFVPSAAAGGSLTTNLTEPASNDFESFTSLQANGQLFAEDLAMLATAASVVVFEADLSSLGQVGDTWSISFASKTFTGTSSIGLEFSSDGVNFVDFGSVNVNTVDTRFAVALGVASTSTAYVRFTFNPVGTDQPFLDQVAISAANVAVPEPSTAVLGGLGLAGLALAGRKRRS